MKEQHTEKKKKKRTKNQTIPRLEFRFFFLFLRRNGPKINIKPLANRNSPTLFGHEKFRFEKGGPISIGQGVY